MFPDTLSQIFYSDSTCSTVLQTINVPVGYCQLNDVDDDGYLTDDGAWDYNEYSCSTSAPSPLSGASVSTR